MSQTFQRTALHTDWTIKASDYPNAEGLNTTIPSLVQEVLSRSGLIPDPYYGTNEDVVQWVGERNWEYELQFAVADYSAERKYRLNFTGLDTYAKVFLNDSLLFEANNMFRSWM